MAAEVNLGPTAPRERVPWTGAGGPPTGEREVFGEPPALGPGQVYTNVVEFKLAVLRQAVKDQCSVHVHRSDASRRFTAICASRVPRGEQEEPSLCAWEVHGLPRTDGTWYVKRYHPEHACVRTHTMPRAPINDFRFLNSKVRALVRLDPTVDGKRVALYVKNLVGLEPNAKQCSAALRRIKKDMFGAAEDSYKKLRNYVEEYQKLDPGATTAFEVGPSGVFMRCFVAPSALKHVFERQLPILAVDGCHTKDNYNHTALFAVSRDAEGELLPLAMALVPGEDGENWGWFMQLLAKHIPALGGTGIPIMSDRDKGLDKALRENFPDVPHWRCAKHLEWNLSDNFGHGAVAHWWPAVSTPNRAQFNKHMALMKRDAPAAYAYVMGDPEANPPVDAVCPPSQWARCYRGMASFAMVTSNFCESFNSAMLAQRGREPPHPPIQLPGMNVLLPELKEEAALSCLS
jgi:hypothetical protein